MTLDYRDWMPTLTLEQLGKRMAEDDIVRRSSGYPEAWIAGRVNTALEAAAVHRPALPEERHRLTDAYRSHLHLLLLQREGEGAAASATGNDPLRRRRGPR